MALPVGLDPMARAGARVEGGSGDKDELQIERNPMLWTLAVVLLVLWLLGLVSSYTLGGFIHILLVVAVVMILVNLVSGRGRA